MSSINLVFIYILYIKVILIALLIKSKKSERNANAIITKKVILLNYSHLAMVEVLGLETSSKCIK